MQDFSDPLFECLRDLLQDPLPSVADLEPPRPFLDADRHLLASLLQKAIRRGDLVAARRASHQLLATDAPRLWRRLMVTAFEDIGLGDLDLAVAMVAATTNGRWRRALGGNQGVLERVLLRACAAVKDRSGDHLASLVCHEPVGEREREVLKEASPSALLEAIGKNAPSEIFPVRAALILAGRYEAKDGLARGATKDIAGVFAALADGGVPPLLIEACRVYARRSYDVLPVLLPSLWQMWRSFAGPRMVAVHCHPAAEPIEEIPSYAFDPLHTRLGREAVERWRESVPIPPAWSAYQLAIALWNFESAACTKTLVWPMGEAIAERAHRADLLARKVPLAEHGVITAWLVEHYEGLHRARRVVWQRLTGSSPVLPSAAECPSPRLLALPIDPAIVPPAVPHVQPFIHRSPSMPSQEVMRLEAGRYRFLTEKLKADFAEIDDETLADTLQGLSDLPEMIEVIIRSSLEDECLIEALKLRIETMNARLTRFKERFWKKRQVSSWAMASATINKIEVVDFSVSLSEGATRVEVFDPANLPDTYLIPAPPKPDRAKLLTALKAGEVIDGASLVQGDAFITVRTR